jgi:hypothetical protein
MAESMIERVARAIVENPPEERQESTPDGWRIIRNFERTARAAIEAMKRPVTDAMIIAGTRAVDNGQNVSEIFDDMIDAALKEERT